MTSLLKISALKKKKAINLKKKIKIQAIHMSIICPVKKQGLGYSSLAL